MKARRETRQAIEREVSAPPGAAGNPTTARGSRVPSLDAATPSFSRCGPPEGCRAHNPEKAGPIPAPAICAVGKSRICGMQGTPGPDQLQRAASEPDVKRVDGATIQGLTPWQPGETGNFDLPPDGHLRRAMERTR